MVISVLSIFTSSIRTGIECCILQQLWAPMWVTMLGHGVMQRGCDLTGVPRKSLLRLLGEHCSDAGERDALLHLSSRDGRDAYNAQV